MHTIDKTSSEPFKWLDTHEWTLDNFWDTICRFKDTRAANIRSPFVQQIDFKGAESRLTGAIEMMVSSIVQAQSQFEAISYAFFEHRGEDSWPIDILSTIAVKAREENPDFKWTVPFLTYIASRASFAEDGQLRAILKNIHYDDNELMPPVLRLLREGGTPIFLVDQALRQRGPEIRKPLCLAALMRYDQAATLDMRQTLHDIIDRAAEFSMDTTARQLAEKVLPEVLPVLDTIISLGLPIEQAWEMVVHNGKTNPLVNLPSDLSPANLTL